MSSTLVCAAPTPVAPLTSAAGARHRKKPILRHLTRLARRVREAMTLAHQNKQHDQIVQALARVTSELKLLRRDVRELQRSSPRLWRSNSGNWMSHVLECRSRHSLSRDELARLESEADAMLAERRARMTEAAFVATRTTYSRAPPAALPPTAPPDICSTEHRPAPAGRFLDRRAAHGLRFASRLESRSSIRYRAMPGSGPGPFHSSSGLLIVGEKLPHSHQAWRSRLWRSTPGCGRSLPVVTAPGVSAAGVLAPGTATTCRRFADRGSARSRLRALLHHRLQSRHRICLRRLARLRLRGSPHSDDRSRDMVSAAETTPRRRALLTMRLQAYRLPGGCRVTGSTHRWPIAPAALRAAARSRHHISVARGRYDHRHGSTGAAPAVRKPRSVSLHRLSPGARHRSPRHGQERSLDFPAGGSRRTPIADRLPAVRRDAGRGDCASRPAPTDRRTSAFLTALLVGERDRLAPDLITSLQRAGIYHIVALSGLHVGLVVLLLGGLLRITPLLSAPAPRRDDRRHRVAIRRPGSRQRLDCARHADGSALPGRLR